jgi:hypothetical protein
MRRVVIASPWAGDEHTHEAYALACLQDSILRGEAPIVPHLYLTRVLADSGDGRKIGMRIGAHLIRGAQALAVYTDLGISAGMNGEITVAERAGVKVEKRTVPTWLDEEQVEAFMRLVVDTRDVFVAEPTELSMPVTDFETVGIPKDEDDAIPFERTDDDTPKGPILGSA